MLSHRWTVALPLLVCVSLARGGPATLSAAPASPEPDLSSPKAAVISLYAALRAGDVAAAQRCLHFADARQAETFDLTVTPLWTPLRLMHALEARFGKDARKPFSAASLEKTVDKALDDLNHAEITITGDTAVVAEKNAAVDPEAETEVTGITLKRKGDRWQVVADTFPDITAEIPPAEIPVMRALRSAVANACQATLDRLAKGEFKSADEAYAAYQSAVQKAARLPAAPASHPAPPMKNR